ncbi:glycosyltransferase family 2 protein [Apibacter sp. HY039]|uniref:glycosyltransferase n=1 Tax=Apibacter sp. HY039 TaxID=2501476 RepID=UPI000FEBE475|nr:glycosyltransferase [Apibacter sp. HY039]
MHGSFRLKLSIIIAVFNRKDELQDLLNSLVKQSDKDFEVVIVDDGSSEKLESCALKYSDKLDIKYFYKENSGAGLARNYGVRLASGNYFIFLDSDCIAPDNYIYKVRANLISKYVDAFGGADSADASFNNLQKAISYSMTSLLTTGGIRGNKKSVDKFQPRSFNMGISKEAFQVTGGFSELRIGEDPDLSLTLWEKGFQTRFFNDCKVFHKRRTSLKKFSRQVYHFGIARPILNLRHPEYVKLTFWFPSLFFIYTIVSLSLLFSYYTNLPFLVKVLATVPFLFLSIYYALIFIDSTIKNKSIQVGFLSIVTTFIQFFSYGFGFLRSYIALNILKISPEKAFPSHYHTQS